MELSSRVEYALAALLELASHSDQEDPLQIKHIAARHDIPNRYLEHVFNALGRAGLVRGLRGVRGGYVLARKPQQITVLEVFECFEDSRAVNPVQAVLSVNRSIVRDTWRDAHQQVKTALKQLTLQDLYQRRLEREQSGSMMYYI